MPKDHQHSYPMSKRLLVSIPCLNEEQTIGILIKEIPGSITGIDAVDILVVDDGSSDNTAECARFNGAHVISHGTNLGVGSAFQTAVGYAVKNKYDFMINIDGDRQFNPKDIPSLTDPILLGTADMVTASRFIDKNQIPKMPVVKLFGNHMMSFLLSMMLGIKFHDVSCGFRCYSREALLHINLHGAFTYTQETFLDLCYKKLKIVEIPISVVYFADRKSRVAGSIIKYAINTSKIIFRGYRDFYPLRFFWSISAIIFIAAIAFASLFFGHFILTGKFTGYLFAGFTSGFLFILTVVFFVLGIVTDMLDRIRANQDRVLYFLKKNQ